MAKDHSLKDTLIMCRLTISIAVQSENNELVIGKIQSLSDTSQHYLMKAIEQVRELSPPMCLRCLPSAGDGQSSGVRRHTGRVDDDRVIMVHYFIANSRLTPPFH